MMLPSKDRRKQVLAEVTLGRNVDCHLLWKNYRGFLKQFKKMTTTELAVPIQGLYPKETD